jgi:hypothetical protein
VEACWCSFRVAKNSFIDRRKPAQQTRPLPATNVQGTSAPLALRDRCMSNLQNRRIISIGCVMYGTTFHDFFLLGSSRAGQKLVTR